MPYEQITHQQIKSIIDDIEQPYAYAYLTQGGSSDYGHMIVEIALPKSKEYSYRRPDGVLKISCQIGSSDASDRSVPSFWKPYAWHLGFDARNGDGELDELEVAVKMLRRIHKYQNKTDFSETFSEWCQRALVGAGVKHLITEGRFWLGSWRNVEGGDLTQVGTASAHMLNTMENALIGKFSKQTT